MTCFPLVPELTSAGESWDAVVPATYTNPATGQSVNINAEVDTGASFSLAPYSLATILGLDLSKDPQISLGGVGGGAIPAFLHSLTLTIGNLSFQGVIIAIANTEAVPFLLGRENFWGFVSIRIDNANRQVCIDPMSGLPMTITSSQTTPLAAAALIGIGLGAAALVTYLLVAK